MPSSDPHSAATNINPKCLLFNAASGASAGIHSFSPVSIVFFVDYSIN
jgi:hypothetical protein